MSFTPKFQAEGSPVDRDPATLSNYQQIVTKHLDISWSIDWEKRIFGGSATLQLESVIDDLKEVVLDASYLDVKKVEVDGKTAEWKFGEQIEIMGTGLYITLPSALSAGTKTSIKITYTTTPECTAVGWLEPNQTKSGKHPYLYSQSQAIHARSLLPCQDTPAVKATYGARVKSGSGLEVLLSALRKEVVDHGDGVREFVYEQPVGIPSYLIAIGAGELVYKPFEKLKGRDWQTGCWTEPDTMDAAFWEFHKDTANFVATAEDLASPYKFGVYDVLFLPDSFPYGGMENACLTFATPTIIAGDRSQVDVVAHEISHSWFGNGIGCASWRHFWLNEGWTTYLERLIVRATHGEQARQLSYIIGRRALVDDLSRLEPRFQRLVTEYKDYEDPDEGYSQVPYEKGANFLYYLEQTVGGLELFVPYMKDYVKTFEGYAITTEQWREHLFHYFGSLKDGDEVLRKLGKVDWDEWLHGDGEDLCVDVKYDDTLSKAVYDLAAKWDKARETNDFSGFSHKDIDSFSTTQLIVLLDKLETYPSFPKSAIKKLDSAYAFGTSGNAEIRLRFYENALKTGPEYAVDASKWVVTKGRMKFNRPVFRLLNEQAPELARKTFEEHKGFYHPIARKMIAKDLGVKE
ncbi:leukotriene A-4 hydrolase/aminopeptidase [Cryptococcus amylolentus CBS 6039]|uniref:Leukotriene A-4 hydrolase/aminopeptidase n=1 Tax=Cryptococcus amylolentus CBS 6039 TaxID=1295533 RepID=A0A1E3HS59_9TREE|nr:leukotriene A-4 hydrolase/aminopeptidase [Cryptococcus amylolentus CBS 6039]ODN78985.1 leukotriene A-4 hydrolase/aminopeptidase [Cryptococcus amylolentus CBS 6039]